MTALAARPDGRARVLIAADHLATRAGVRLALEAEADCSEAENTGAAVEAAVRERPDVCVVDFAPPSRSIRAAAAILLQAPGSAVVVLTRRVNEDEFLAAMRAGARGYLSEGVDPARLPHVVRGLMRGEAAVPRLFVRCLIDELRGRDRPHHLELHEHRRVELTAREWEVVQALRQGMSTKEIAALLGISEVTVRRHTSGVHQKLGIRSRAELLRLLDEGGSEAE
ncbi:MAG: LuxR C-terminal-related transcriptional regulator [Gaiellaceae bacterium]